MFKNVAKWPLSHLGDSLVSADLKRLSLYINKRDRKPFFSDVLFDSIYSDDRDFELREREWKTPARGLHDHGIRTHCLLDFLDKYEPRSHKVESVEIHQLTHKVMNLVKKCQFDGVTVRFRQKVQSDDEYHYCLKILESFKRHPEFADKTLGFFGEYQGWPRGGSMDDIESIFKKDKAHNHQVASLLDAVYIIGDDEPHLYTPTASSEPHDKYFASGIPKDKFYTFGYFDLRWHSPDAEKLTLGQIQKNRWCQGIIGQYRVFGGGLQTRLSYYTRLLRAETGNNEDEVILASSHT